MYTMIEDKTNKIHKVYYSHGSEHKSWVCDIWKGESGKSEIWFNPDLSLWGMKGSVVQNVALLIKDFEGV